VLNRPVNGFGRPNPAASHNFGYAFTERLSLNEGRAAPPILPFVRLFLAPGPKSPPER
jgi:hypothetical protein